MLPAVILAYDASLRRERVFKVPLDPLHISDKHLIRYYRFPRHAILQLCADLEHDIGRLTLRSRAIPCHTCLLVVLRFYASGSFQSVIADTTGLSQASVSRIINCVTDALYRKARVEIKMPRGMNEIINTKRDFQSKSGFPNTIGAIDCTHIPIKAPRDSEYMYVNRKSYHSINIQVVSNTENIIMDFCARYPGSTHDSFIWANSRLRERFESREFGSAFLLGDSGYPLEPYIMTPVSQPSSVPEERYNRRHSKTRVVIEQTFGILKSRFRSLHRSGGSLQYTPDKCAKIAVACMLLHNYCFEQKIPADYETVDNDDPPPSEPEDHQNVTYGQTIRREIIDNYCT